MSYIRHPIPIDTSIVLQKLIIITLSHQKEVQVGMQWFVLSPKILYT